MIPEVPIGPCDITISLAARKKAGSLTSTVTIKVTTKEIVFKLKQKGKAPVLKEIQISQEEKDRIAREGPVIDPA